jgi:AraC family transcriptional regulator
MMEVPGLESALVSVHIGGPTRVDCHRADRHFSGTAVHGDIDIVPRYTPARWKLVGDADRSILLSLPYSLLQSVAAVPSDVPIELLNRFQVRDPVLESLATAAVREIEDGHPSGEAYLDGIGLAAASRLTACHRSEESLSDPLYEAFTGHRLKGVLSYIEDRLGADLTLREIASSVGLSSSHLTSLFRKTMGITVHQHLVKRRVERAKALLLDSALSIVDVALAVGFAHQSHMARHMVGCLGSDREIEATETQRVIDMFVSELCFVSPNVRDLGIASDRD